MAIKYTFTEFPTGVVAKALAQNGGAHIYSVTISEDLPNGVFVGKGAFVELDHYNDAAAGAVTAEIVGKAANGNFYVEIKTCDEGTLFLSNVPMIEEEYNNSFKRETLYYNPANTEVRAYQLRPGDIIEVNAKALSLSADPASYPVAVTASTYDTSLVAKALA